MTGVVIKTGEIFPTRAIILATGTYLKGLILMGEVQYEGGPHGTQSAKELSFSLRDLGIMLRQFKTGTPTRIQSVSIKYFSALFPAVLQTPPRMAALFTKKEMKLGKAYID